MPEISEKELERLNRLKKSREKQLKRQNKFISENRDRVTVILPKGTKERIKNITDKSVNGYINDLILKDLEMREKNNTNDVDIELLLKH